ncbi:hypothetical protein CY35_09G033200 [Sphagnum magellanicum]|jgi:hypothetical protein|nr:hypothetical protein CY35_09G033200 [Sphagnum magellanicum]
MAQLDRTASLSLREGMAAVQRSNSGVKENSSTPILQRTSSMLKGTLQQLPAQLKSLPSLSLKDQQGGGAGGANKFGSAAIRNRNIVIAVLSTFLFLAVVSWPWHGSMMGASFQRADVLLGVSRVAEGGTSDPFQSKWANAGRVLPYHRQLEASKKLGSTKFLVTPAPLLVPYHKGPVLTGEGGVLKVYLIYYGLFSPSQRATVSSFLASFAAKPVAGTPSVAGWWAITGGFKDAANEAVAKTVVAGESYDYATYSKGKSLLYSDIEALVTGAIAAGGVPLDATGLYVVLTAADVTVQGFCSLECGTHLYTSPVKATQNHALTYAWVGNAANQCPGFCDWPYATAAPGTGPDTPALKPPNSDVGIDGLIITLASLMAGAATNPYANAYFQGDAADPLEIAGVCGGIYGEGAYPGNPGTLLVDKKGASFNAYGTDGREFLLPWIYNPATKQCAGQI